MVRILMVAALVAGAAVAADKKVVLDGTNTKVTFIGTKPDGKHEGGFKTLKGTAAMDASDLTTLKLEVEIETASLYSDNDKLTGHLKSPDFFNVKENKKASFKSSKVAKDGDGYKVTGDLTLCGKTKEVTFPATIKAGSDGLALSSTFKIDRNDWGMTYGKGKVDAEVTIGIELKAK